MKQVFTFPVLKKLIDTADAQLSGFPHGNSVLLRDGRSRPMTVRDQFAPVLAVFAGPNPPERVRLDLDLFIDYWRDCILALDPPAHRSISSKRLQEKGRHAVVIPTFGGPALRPAVCHFEFLDVIGTPGLCDLRVQRVRQGFRRKIVLGKKHRFNPPPENLICFGSAEKLRTLIYSQRGRPPENPVAVLRQYLADVVGQSPERVEQYAVLLEWSLAADEGQ